MDASHCPHLCQKQDPDCDRLGLVEGGAPTPTPLNRNRLIALAAAMVLRAHPGTTIVTDSVTSEGLRRFIERRGGRHLRWVLVVGVGVGVGVVCVDWPVTSMYHIY